MRALSEYDPEELRRELAGLGFRTGHASAILRAFYAQAPGNPFAGLALPGALAELLRQAAEPAPGAIRRVAADGTLKLLLPLADGRSVESVLMPDFRADRAAGCVSSQVGCAMGCDFCATAQGGFGRNLTAGEIVAQFLALRREAVALGRTLRTLVFMGMGEPMLNLDAVLEAIRRIAPNELGALGWRQVTVSTVGIVPGIDALAETGLGVHLAVSLHAPDDATRGRLIPAGRRYGVGAVLSAADRYQERTGRPVTIQYCLLGGVNDSPGQARLLAGLVGARRMHVNLLRYNQTGTGLGGVSYAPSSDAALAVFLGILRGLGVVAHFRRPRGEDIEAACGQLRRTASAAA